MSYSMTTYEDVFFYHDQLRKTWEQNYSLMQICLILIKNICVLSLSKLYWIPDLCTSTTLPWLAVLSTNPTRGSLGHQLGETYAPIPELTWSMPQVHLKDFHSPSCHCPSCYYPSCYWWNFPSLFEHQSILIFRLHFHSLPIGHHNLQL